MGALKIRKNSNHLTVISKTEDGTHFFQVSNNDEVEYQGSCKDGFQDSDVMGKVIDNDELSQELKKKISKWFN